MVVVVFPFLSTDTTCCACPVASLLLRRIDRLVLLRCTTGNYCHAQHQRAPRLQPTKMNRRIRFHCSHPLSRSLDLSLPKFHTPSFWSNPCAHSKGGRPASVFVLLYGAAPKARP